MAKGLTVKPSSPKTINRNNDGNHPEQKTKAKQGTYDKKANSGSANNIGLPINTAPINSNKK